VPRIREPLERKLPDSCLPAPASAVIPFWDRPYRTVDDAIQEGLLADISDPDVVRLPPSVGSIEQWVNSVDVLSSAGRGDRPCRPPTWHGPALIPAEVPHGVHAPDNKPFATADTMAG
jgi:hypothetical protein